jgi:excisionase family DNA binding protein
MTKVREATQEQPRATMSIESAAKRLGIGRSAAYEAARNGQIPVIRIGKRLLVPIVAMERMLAEAKPLPLEGPPAKPEAA